jgi:hypothetical protein
MSQDAQALNAQNDLVRRAALTQSTAGMATLHHVLPPKGEEGGNRIAYRRIVTVGPSSMRTTRPSSGY